MVFFITSETSYEIATPSTIELEDRLKAFFEDKKYDKTISKISAIVICVSKEFEALHPVRPPKVGKDKILFECKLDFEKYKQMTEEERIKYLVVEYFKTIKEVLANKKIKNFDNFAFLQDLDAFFKNEGYIG